MFIDETIELREDLPERLWRDFAELRKYYDAGDWFNFDIFFEGLRQPSRDIIWRGKPAGQTWTVFFGNMGFCERNLSGNGKGDYLWKIR